MRVRYDGSIDAVELPQLTNVVVQRGQTVEIPDALGAQLIEQSCWSQVDVRAEDQSGPVDPEDADDETEEEGD